MILKFYDTFASDCDYPLMLLKLQKVLKIFIQIQQHFIQISEISIIIS